MIHIMLNDLCRPSSKILHMSFHFKSLELHFYSPFSSIHYIISHAFIYQSRKKFFHYRNFALPRFSSGCRSITVILIAKSSKYRIVIKAKKSLYTTTV